MLLKLSLITVALCSLVPIISSAVLGIDFGTEYIKSSLISPGKSFVIIEDTTSKRKTPSSVHFINFENNNNNNDSYVFRKINAFMNMNAEVNGTGIHKALSSPCVNICNSEESMKSSSRVTLKLIMSS